MAFIVLTLIIVLAFISALTLFFYLYRVSFETSQNFSFWSFFHKQEYINRHQKIKDFISGVGANILLITAFYFLNDGSVWIALPMPLVVGLLMLITRKFLGFGLISIALLLPLFEILKLANQIGLLGLILLFATIFASNVLVRQFKALT